MFPGAHLEIHASKPAVIVPETGFSQSFAELDARANQLSRMLRSVGMYPGDSIAICLENHERYLEIVWGCHYAGLIYTCISSRLTANEVAYIVNDCSAGVFITSKQFADIAETIVADTPDVDLRIIVDADIDGHLWYERSLDGHSPEPLDEDRIAGMEMLYSSGTTGFPKGVLRNFPNEPIDSRSNGVVSVQDTIYGMDNTSVYLSPAPLYHAAPLKFCTAAHALGATVVVMQHFDAAEYLVHLEEFRVTHSQVVPTMFIRLLKLPDDARNAVDISSLECVIHAAAPCPQPVKYSMIEWFGPIIHEYYAGTERNGYVHCDTQDWLDHPGTVGRAVNCVIHIVDDDGNELPTEETGGVYFEGGAEFSYHNDPDKTAESYLTSGWSTLGDIGHLDEDGFLYLTDRKSYTIISGGVNIYPQEAENLLSTHPAVADVAVFGVPNADFGEEVKAVVKPTDDVTDPVAQAGLEAELIAFCKASLSAMKCPRSVDFRSELPRLPTGKLYKRLLKDEYAKEARHR